MSGIAPPFAEKTGARASGAVDEWTFGLWSLEQVAGLLSFHSVLGRWSKNEGSPLTCPLLRP